jgi:stalled ribosome rescue protein Dom34
LKNLEWGDYRKRKIMTRFRLSAHDLEIEKGRYTGVKAHQIFCKLCSSEVEDEINFLLKCSALDTIRSRSSFIENIKSYDNNFESLSDKDKLIWLLSSEVTEYNTILDNLCKLLNSLFDEREKNL